MLKQIKEYIKLEVEVIKGKWLIRQNKGGVRQCYSREIKIERKR